MMTGKTILLTRAPGQEDRIGQALQNQGARVMHIPLIQMVPNPLESEILTNLTKGTYHWLCFTSSNGVESFFSQYANKISAESLKAKIAVFGIRTAATVQRWGYPIKIVNKGSSAVELGRELGRVVGNPARVLLLLGNLAPDFLEESIRDKAEVTRSNVYTTSPKKLENAMVGRISATDYDLMIITSPSAFYSMKQNGLDAPSVAKGQIACLGPTTAATLLSEGIEPVITAKPSDRPGLIEQIEQFFANSQKEHSNI